MDAKTLNFSWVIEGKLAGCTGPILGNDLQFIASQGVHALVRLARKEEGAFSTEDVIEAGLEDYHEPVPDFTAPMQEQIHRVIQFIDRCLEQGKSVAVSCGAGKGRTGTILSCYFASQGLSPRMRLLR